VVAGAWGGAFWGFLIGLLFFVPFLGLALGAVTAALMGAFTDVGIDDRFIREVQEQVQPGQSALFLLVREVTLDRVLAALRPYHPAVLQTSLSAEQEAKLREALGGAPAEAVAAAAAAAAEPAAAAADGAAAAEPTAAPAPLVAAAAGALLFDGAATDAWRMSTITNQPGRDDPGRFVVVDGALEAAPGTEQGLLWHTTPTPPDFVLTLEWVRWLDTDDSGVFVRFPHPDSKGYDNTAFVAGDFGFEVQIDERGWPDGAGIHGTGAIYDQPGQVLTRQPARPPGQWNRYEIRVQGQTYTVALNGTQVTSFTFTPGSDPAHPDRELPGTTAVPRFIGLQTHTGRVAFRDIWITAI
jgi:hypothetical protein